MTALIPCCRSRARDDVACCINPAGKIVGPYGEPIESTAHARSDVWKIKFRTDDGARRSVKLIFQHKTRALDGSLIEVYRVGTCGDWLRRIENGQGAMWDLWREAGVRLEHAYVGGTNV